MTEGEREHRAKYIRMSMLVDKFIFEDLFKGIVGLSIILLALACGYENESQEDRYTHSDTVIISGHEFRRSRNGVVVPLYHSPSCPYDN
jgi:hypothetical protein